MHKQRDIVHTLTQWRHQDWKNSSESNAAATAFRSSAIYRGGASRGSRIKTKSPHSLNIFQPARRGMAVAPPAPDDSHHYR
jgi:hypothetical protein